MTLWEGGKQWYGGGGGKSFHFMKPPFPPPQKYDDLVQFELFLQNIYKEIVRRINYPSISFGNWIELKWDEFKGYFNGFNIVFSLCNQNKMFSFFHDNHCVKVQSYSAKIIIEALYLFSCLLGVSSLTIKKLKHFYICSRSLHLFSLNRCLFLYAKKIVRKINYM